MEYEKIIEPFVVKRNKYIPKNQDFYTSSAACRCWLIKPGGKVFYRNEKECLEVSEELTKVGIKNRVAQNPESGLWSIAILDTGGESNDTREYNL